ncbi:MAG TPA: FUSC family protein [Geminicoccaceae bacterium]|nr:FUSC family protein [Geminicoccaceae bacterium]
MSAEIAGGFTGTLARAGPGMPETQPLRRALARRVIALDPIIDEAFGESSRLRYHSPVLQHAVDGLFAGLAGWRTVATHLAQLPDERARAAAQVVLRGVPQALRSVADAAAPNRWMEDPVRLREVCETAGRTLVAQPVATPSLRLLADQTAKLLAGVAQALQGLALLVADPARPPAPHGRVRLRIPDWLPSLVNAGRALAAIGAVELFWIVTAWPDGALAITFAVIGVTLFAPRADQAYAMVRDFMIGTVLAAVLAAIVKFAVLPGMSTFAGFSIALGLYLVPVAAAIVQPWQTGIFIAMTINFVPLLAPANQMIYDTAQFYNTTLAILVGTAAAALSFRLLPPLSPALRTRRLLALTLRDLRHLATGAVAWTPEDWEACIYGRLSAMPEQAEPLQRAQLLAALSVGSEIIGLRRICPGLGLGGQLGTAFAALAQGRSEAASARLARLDRLLARPGPAAAPQLGLRARSHILAISEALARHAAYFDAGAPA